MRITNALMLCTFLAGCASSGQQMSQEQLAQIHPGQTTKTQMVKMFGQPLSQAYGTEGKLSATWFYVHVGPFGTGMKQQNLAVLFDEQERVEKYTISDNVNKTPAGE